MAPHSSTLDWKIPRTEEPGSLQSMGSQSRTHLSDSTFPSGGAAQPDSPRRTQGSCTAERLGQPQQPRLSPSSHFPNRACPPGPVHSGGCSGGVAVPWPGRASQTHLLRLLRQEGSMGSLTPGLRVPPLGLPSVFP